MNYHFAFIFLQRSRVIPVWINNFHNRHSPFVDPSANLPKRACSSSILRNIALFAWLRSQTGWNQKKGLQTFHFLGEGSETLKASSGTWQAVGT
jgi:hypothetical protein